MRIFIHNMVVFIVVKQHTSHPSHFDRVSFKDGTKHRVHAMRCFQTLCWFNLGEVFKACSILQRGIGAIQTASVLILR